jgi:hypothetical protein
MNKSLYNHKYINIFRTSGAGLNPLALNHVVMYEHNTRFPPVKIIIPLTKRFASLPYASKRNFS